MEPFPLNNLSESFCICLSSSIKKTSAVFPIRLGLRADNRHNMGGTLIFGHVELVYIDP